MKNVTIQKINSKIGSLIYCNRIKNVTFDNVFIDNSENKLFENFTKEVGKFIKINFGGFMLFNNCIFFFINTNNNGFLKYSFGIFKIKNSSFSKLKYSHSPFFIVSDSEISLENSILKDSLNIENSQKNFAFFKIENSVLNINHSKVLNFNCSKCKGGILFLKATRINIIHSKFQNSIGKIGGVIYSTKIFDSNPNIILNTSFINNNAEHSGVLYLIDQYIKLKDILFEKNSAKIIAGCIFMNYSHLNLSRSKMENIFFKENFARIGATLAYYMLIPIFNNLKFLNNTVKLYGRFLTSSPRRLKLKIGHKIFDNKDFYANNSRTGGNLRNLQFLLFNENDEIIEEFNGNPKLNFQIISADNNYYSVQSSNDVIFQNKSKGFPLVNLKVIGSINTETIIKVSTEAIFIPINSSHFRNKYTFE